MDGIPMDEEIEWMLTDPDMDLFRSEDIFNSLSVESDPLFTESNDMERNKLDATVVSDGPDSLLDNMCLQLDTQENFDVDDILYAPPSAKSTTSSGYGGSSTMVSVPQSPNAPIIDVLQVAQSPKAPTIDVLQMATNEIFGDGSFDPNFFLSNKTINTGRRKYPPLILTDEEKRICEKEGIRLPEFYPLTKSEEKNLTRLRRRIRNRNAARATRKKKQEYIEALEDRIEFCSQENEELKKQVEQLKKLNLSYVTQLRKLQRVVANGSKRRVHAGTCLAVLMLSVCLLVAPNLSSMTRKRSKNEAEQITTSSQTKVETKQSLAGRSRSLLHYMSAVTDNKCDDFCDEDDDIKAEPSLINNRSMCKGKRFAFFDGDARAQNRSYFLANRNRVISNYGYGGFINRTRKRYVPLQENSYAPSYHKKLWNHTSKNAEYKKAELLSRPTFSVYANPGGYISLVPKRIKLQQS